MQKYIDRITKTQDMLKKKCRCKKKHKHVYPKQTIAKKTKNNTDKTIDFGKDLQGLGKSFNKLHNKATVPAFSSLVHLLSVSLFKVIHTAAIYTQTDSNRQHLWFILVPFYPVLAWLGRVQTCWKQITLFDDDLVKIALQRKTPASYWLIGKVQSNTTYMDSQHTQELESAQGFPYSKD